VTEEKQFLAEAQGSQRKARKETALVFLGELCGLASNCFFSAGSGEH
jgi:hypothetical protein